MWERIAELDPATIQGWIAVVAGLIALVGAYRHSAETSRWAKIRGLIPDAHRLAQRVAAQTRTKKDDEFLRQLERLLGAFGIELTRPEAEAARAMGSAEHQTFKLLRDGPEERNELVALPPVGAPDAPSPASGASSKGSERPDAAV